MTQEPKVKEIKQKLSALKIKGVTKVNKENKKFYLDIIKQHERQIEKQKELPSPIRKGELPKYLRDEPIFSIDIDELREQKLSRLVLYLTSTDIPKSKEELLITLIKEKSPKDKSEIVKELKLYIPKGNPKYKEIEKVLKA